MEYKLSSLTSEFAENVFPVLYTQENINSKNILKQHFSGNKRVNPDRILMVPVIKSIDWTYEKQWRYVRDNPSVKKDFPYHQSYYLPCLSIRLAYVHAVIHHDRRKHHAHAHSHLIEDIRKRRNIKLAKMDLSSKKMGMVPVFPRS